MYNLTQTTGNQRSQGRVCPTTTSLDMPGCVDTLALQVYAFFLHQHRRRLASKRNTSVPVYWKEQANGLVPYLRARPTGYPQKLYRTILSQGQKSGNPSTLPLFPLPQTRNGTFIPSHEWRRDFPCRFVNLSWHLKVSTYQRIACYAIVSLANSYVNT